VFITSISDVDFPEPWTESFCDRLMRLGQGARRVAYFYHRPDMSTFRYRVLNMIEALATIEVGVSASWFSDDDLSRIDAILERADVIVICRCRYSVGFATLIARARFLGRRIFYDVDDLVFDDRYVHLVINAIDEPTHERSFDFWFAYLGRLGALLRLCDGVILTTEYLAERVRQFCGLPTAVVPNFMNAAQVEHSALILDEKRSSGFMRDGRIHVGYFSGSATHARDFAIIEDALFDLMEEDDRIVLRVVGKLQLNSRFGHFAERVEVFPMQNILNLQRLIGEVEFNVVPLQDNVFANCKSELKVFEASAVGTISIASPAFALRRAIRDGDTGHIVSAHHWRQTIAVAIGRLDSYPEMAMAAAAAALWHYVPRAQGPGVIRALFGDGVGGSI